MRSKKILSALAIITIAAFVLTPAIALGASSIDPSDLLEETGEEAGFESSGSGQQQLTSMVGLIINVLLSLLGIIFLVLIIYGGFLWMTSSGNEEQVKKAKTIIRDAIIGLIILLAAYAISRFVVDALVEATGA